MLDYVYKWGDLNPEDRALFCEMLPYLSTGIQEISFDQESCIIRHSEGYGEEIDAKIEFLKNVISASQFNNTKTMPITTLHDNCDRSTINNASVFEEMIAQEIVKKIGPGLYAYSGLFLNIMRYFSAKIKAFAEENFPNCKEFEVASLCPLDTFSRGKYFETFPHHVMFQTEMKNDIEVLHRFAQRGINEPEILREMNMPHKVLRHAACVPIYPFLQDRILDEKQPVSFLVSGKCFRNESAYVQELSRLSEFTMAEYVFVGTPEQVSEKITQSFDLWHFWSDIFKLNCKIDTANDSFFASNYKKLKMFQLLGDSKQEFKILLPHNGTYVASSSANFHRTHFTKSHNIRNDKVYCHSGCFAFGIERLAYTLLSQKGLNPERWDQATIDEISRYSSL